MTTPRFQELDENWIITVRLSYERLLEDHLAAIPKTQGERLLYAWDAVANDYRELACVSYAAGDALAEVGRLLKESARAQLEVLKLRGSGQPDRGQPVSQRREYATGNSCAAYWAICMALSVGERNVADAMAPLVWDPVDARYLAPNSVLCTTNQQALAYALKYLLLGSIAEADAQLKRLTRVGEDEVGEMLMLQGIRAGDSSRASDGLSRTLAWHARVAAEKANYRVAKYFLCIPALGLSALALAGGTLSREQLPPDNVFFPRDLIAG